jgi:hypothetical protein
MKKLSKEECIILENKVEKFLNEEVYSWEILEEDEKWDKEGRVGESLEEKIILEIISILKERIKY